MGLGDCRVGGDGAHRCRKRRVQGRREELPWQDVDPGGDGADLWKSDFEKHEFTERSLGSSAISRGHEVQPHLRACRKSPGDQFGQGGEDQEYQGATAGAGEEEPGRVEKPAKRWELAKFEDQRGGARPVGPVRAVQERLNDFEKQGEQEKVESAGERQRHAGGREWIAGLSSL